MQHPQRKMTYIKETICLVRKDPKSTDYYVGMFDGIKSLGILTFSPEAA